MKLSYKTLRTIVKVKKNKKLIIIAVLMILISMVSMVSFKQILDKTEKKRTMPIEFLVVHYTANLSPGADATANAYYLQKKRRVGTHYCIDDNEIIQCTEEGDIAYSVGDRHWRGFVPKPWYDRKIFNNNSLNFEMCLGGGRNDSLIIESTAQFIGWQLVNKGLDISRVVRHHDVSGKHCPKFLYNSDWNEMREDSCWKVFLGVVERYQHYHLVRKQIFKDKGIWTDTIPENVGETTLKFQVQ